MPAEFASWRHRWTPGRRKEVEPTREYAEKLDAAVVDDGPAIAFAGIPIESGGIRSFSEVIEAPPVDDQLLLCRASESCGSP